MCSYGTTDRHYIKSVSMVAPQMCTVCNIFLQKCIIKTRIA